jgi:hypothetical protein
MKKSRFTEEQITYALPGRMACLPARCETGYGSAIGRFCDGRKLWQR